MRANDNTDARELCEATTPDEREIMALRERNEARAALVRKQTIIDEVSRSLDSAGIAPDAPIAMRIDRLAAERDALKAEVEQLRNQRDHAWADLRAAREECERMRIQGIDECIGILASRRAHYECYRTR